MGSAGSTASPEQLAQYRRMYRAQYGCDPPGMASPRQPDPRTLPHRQGTFVLDERRDSMPGSRASISSRSSSVVLPPIGFRPEVVDGPEMEDINPDHDQDCSKDITLTRVMSADEFLGRMDDTDDQLRNLAELNDDGMKPRMLELLGLRGHLQDELLRIQAMLFKDDPQLHCLRDFEDMCPRAVSKIRELTVKAKAIQAIASGTQTANSNSQSNTGSQSRPGRRRGSQSQGTNSSTTVDEEGIQLDMDVLGEINTTLNLGPETTGAGGSGEASDTAQPVDITENDLKVKHDQEEQHVAQSYLRKMKERGKLPPDELERLLNDHLLSMQALRKRQELEKDKLNRHLDALKKGRLLSRAQVSQGMVPQKPVRTASIQPKFVQGVSFWVDAKESRDLKERRTEPSGAGGRRQMDNKNKDDIFWVDMGKSKGKGAKIPLKSPRIDISHMIPQQTRPRSGSRTKIDLSDVPFGSQSNRPGSSGSRQLGRSGSTVSSRSGSDIVDRQSQDSGTCSMSEDKPGSDLDSDTDLQDIIASVNNSRPSTASYADDFEEDESEDETDNMRGTLEKDLWSNRNKMTSEDFKAMMGKFREQQDERERIKDAEKNKHKGSLLARLAESKRKKRQEDQGEEDDTDEAAGAADEMTGQPDPTEPPPSAPNGDAKLEQAIRGKEETLLETVLSRNRHMTDDEFEDMLRRHLVDVDDLRKRRRGEKDKLDEKLREKLRRRKGLKQGAGSDEDNGQDTQDLDDEELQQLEEDFRQEVRRKRRYLTEEDLQALLERHRRDRARLLSKKTAERGRTDDKLSQKLRERQKKRLEAADDSQSDSEEDKQGVSSMDDKFFQELQRRQGGGQLTEAMFADMLQTYISEADGARRKEAQAERRKQREEERRKEADCARETASSLVQEHQEQAKQIHNIRRRERQAMDERLRRKLGAKKHKRHTQEAAVES